MKARLSIPGSGVTVQTSVGSVEVRPTSDDCGDFSVTVVGMQHGQATAIDFIPAHTHDQVFHCLEARFGDVEVEFRPEILGYSESTAPLVVTGHLRKPDTSQVIFHRVYLSTDGEWKLLPEDHKIPPDALRIDLPSIINAIKAMDQKP